jgi:hypothetical protein
MGERRTTPRRRVLKAGSVLFGVSDIDCTVRSLSEAGAALEIAKPTFIPDRFTLVVPTDNLKRRCRIAWRKGKRFGIKFE